MKFTLSWLKEHLETKAKIDVITDTLTNIGLEVENIEDKENDYKDFTIAKVISADTVSYTHLTLPTIYSV